MPVVSSSGCRRLLATAVTLQFTCAIALGAQATPEQLEFFEKRIRPVLVRSCYPCHSAAVKAPMGDLRVDTREGLLAGGKGGAALHPGDPGGSLLLQALSYKHDVKMPPSGKLPDEQIADFEAWIRMGAPDPRDTAPAAAKEPRDRNFWSFRPIVDPAVPEVRNKSYIRSPIDAFLLSRLEAKGLEPTAATDKRTLIRRVTYDLTGLPPTVDEVNAFLKDNSPEAFRRVVDRLLASPHYGERWARHWLDLVRYAETNGHEYDNDKLAPWRYRDYVIRAFNADVPYDRFVREHIAGDLLPDKRTTPDHAFEESPLGTSFFWFGEVLNSATDSVKSRADQVDNQIDVLGKAFLGLTIACARCHDHKFDPIPTADYYALAGVLHSTDIREAAIDSPERVQKLQELSRKIRAVNTEIDEITRLKPATRPGYVYRPEDKVFERFEDTFGNWRTSDVAFGDGPENDTASSLAGGSEKFAGSLTSPKFRTDDHQYLHVRISGTKGDPKLKERGLLRFTSICDGFKGQHVTPEGSAGWKWKTLKLVFERNRICQFEIIDYSRDGYVAVDEIVFSNSKEPPATEEETPTGAPVNLADAQEQRLQELHRKKRELEAQIPESAFAMLASEEQPHNVKLHIRGSHTNLGEDVPRGFLRLVAGENRQPIQQGSGRLQVAEWLSDSRNPLTARVMVNRIWKHHFAEGIVRSMDNFGATGDPPTHPELLDYLASRFIESGWSVKAMHRLIVLSNAYQMSSKASEAALKLDPENKLLHHAPVRRLEAEAIRDGILSVAGTLNEEMYGPSVSPHISEYQDGRGKPESGPLDGNGRRSIYVQVRRNFLTPMFLAFDYPLPISSIGSRGVSTVPSQALLLMNNEFVAEQARVWAERISMAEAKGPARISSMYEAAFSRMPEAAEKDEILEFAGMQRERYSKAGEPPDEIDRRVWGDIAHVLFNSPEFIYLR